MILTGNEIIRRQFKGDIYIDNFDPSKVNPNSYNLTLDNELLVYTDAILDMKSENAYERIIIPDEGIVLEPNKLYLGRTKERTVTHNLVPMLEGRSSTGRLGLGSHVCAGFGDVGFDGYWTLELFCIQPLRIYAGAEVCQIYYHECAGSISEYNSGKYQHNNGVQASKMYMDFKQKIAYNLK